MTNRLANGLDKLNGANVAVEEMKIKLTAMQPELQKAQIETKKMMDHLEIEAASASET